MEVKLTRITTDPLMAIENAASKCYNSEPSTTGRILNACYRNGHHSVFEHVVYTWDVSGVSRALLAQLTRHRIASFSVQSQRYVSYAKGFDYVTPPSIIALGSDAVNEYDRQMAQIHEWYKGWQDKLGGEDEKSNEDARFVLPNACCTTLTVTMNDREFMKTCNERLCKRAQWEIRQMIGLMRDEVLRVFPEATHRFVPKCLADPKHPYCKEAKSQSCNMFPVLDEVYRLPAAEHPKASASVTTAY